MNDLERRITALEHQHQETLLKILNALESSADGGRVGLQESVRVLTTKLHALTENVNSLMTVVAKHEEAKQQAKGAYWMCCLIGSGGGVAVSFIFNHFWK
jgi:hypothetical protein